MHLLQLAQQLPCVPEEACWEFLSSRMAPLSVEASPTSGTMFEEPNDPVEVINTFVEAISTTISTLSITEVCVTIISVMHYTIHPSILGSDSIHEHVNHIATKAGCC